MSTLILLRHGRSTANGAGVLAGRSEGIDLDDTGVEQANGLLQRFSGARVALLVSSPMLRCRRTIQPLADHLGLEVEIDERIAEVDYGSWTGRALKDLAGEPLWRTVQAHPSAAVFPDGESLAEVSVRAVAAAREHAAAAGDDGAAVLCTHGDVIKAILADALGIHLDGFQRIVVGTASLSVVRYTPVRPFVERVNDTGSLRGIGEPERPATTEEVTDGDPAHGHPTDGHQTDADATDGWVAAGDAPVGGEPGVPEEPGQPAGSARQRRDNAGVA
jgi:probable phosphomutase (TIGR03848 family)